MLSKAMFAEALATFALCFIGGGVICADAMLGDKGPGLLGIAIAHGLILAIGVSATMNISGGHVNPAVTIAMLVTGRIKLLPALGYIAAQCIGGAVGGILLSFVVFVNTFMPLKADLNTRDLDMSERASMSAVPSTAVMDVTAETLNGTPHYDVMKLGPRSSELLSTTQAAARREEFATTAAVKAVAIESILTFLLVFAVFGTAVDPRHPKVGGFGVGLTIACCILVGGPLTGAAMNPARVFGTGIVTMDPTFFHQQWVYWLGPILGAVIAAFFYEFLVLDKNAKAA